MTKDEMREFLETKRDEFLSEGGVIQKMKPKFAQGFLPFDSLFSIDFSTVQDQDCYEIGVKFKLRKLYGEKSN